MPSVGPSFRIKCRLRFRLGRHLSISTALLCKRGQKRVTSINGGTAPIGNCGDGFTEGCVTLGKILGCGLVKELGMKMKIRPALRFGSGVVVKGAVGSTFSIPIIIGTTCTFGCFSLTLACGRKAYGMVGKIPCVGSKQAHSLRISVFIPVFQ